MDTTELLDALYYQLVLGAPDKETARANLDRVLTDITDLRDTLDILGLKGVAEAVAQANRSQDVPA